MYTIAVHDGFLYNLTFEFIFLKEKVYKDAEYFSNAEFLSDIFEKLANFP